MAQQYALLASAPDETGIMKCIHEFYCGQHMRLLGGNVQRISDGKILDNVRVIQKRGRYRFERMA